jgi:peptide/nickel transport system substrate-binding protein
MNAGNSVQTRRRFLQTLLVTAGFTSMGVVAAACAPSAAPAASTSSGPATSSGSALTPTAGGTLKMGLQFPIQIADPNNYKGSGDFWVFANIYDRLVELDFTNLTPKPSLATSWGAVDDTTWELKLRQGVKFSDGTPFNAAAAKMNLDRAAQSPGSQPYTGTMASVDAPDDQTLVIKTTAPYAQTIFNLGAFQMSIMAPSAIAKGQDFLASNGIGTGPFTIQEWASGDHFTLARNPNYWQNQAKLDSVILRNIQDDNSRMAALQSGDLDIMVNPPAPAVKQLSADSRIDVRKINTTGTYMLLYQLQDPVMKVLQVRQAIAAAIDRQALVDQVTQGLLRQANGFMTPEGLDAAGSDPGFVIQHNPDQARQLLQQSGMDLGSVRLQMLPTYSVVSADAVALAIQADLKKVGLNADIVQLDNATVQDKYKAHEYQIGPQGWNTSDPDTALRKVFSSRGAWRYPNLDDPAFEAKLDQASATLDDAKRQALYKDIFQGLLDSAYYLPLFNYVNIVAVNKKVQGLGWSPLNVPFLGGVSLSA